MDIYRAESPVSLEKGAGTAGFGFLFPWLMASHAGALLLAPQELISGEGSVSQRVKLCRTDYFSHTNTFLPPLCLYLRRGSGT